MRENIFCPICDYDYTHILGTIQFITDEYWVSEVLVNQKYSIPVKFEYNFRSQGNIHILFRCERGHYFVVSFDGYKGIVFVNENTLVNELLGYLNETADDKFGFKFSIDFNLVGRIETFLENKEFELANKMK
ncbi:hypothetical protein AWH56_008600 [Anaerobacillus isosaccharinicus]|uniref:Uncharacterized protein n=1 Tax=Anaerobacillus isosaccharinicus TaxID=1532552 RepID=A0A1S2L0Y4_9BACI|nr:hypothetical protein [Anaerobacillus isosaccharinicus]MBA5583956.1 hypothetical protein [Anaerobacillus isosaccharinicus]QOY37624.1 hypothetical protein AWH56_008600 [Anaerobacillus isosaccharinicus]